MCARLATSKQDLPVLLHSRVAVVVSEEQGEVEKFDKWDLDIIPPRRLIPRESVARQGGDPRCRPGCDSRFPLERRDRLARRRLLGSRSWNQDGRRIPARVPRLSNSTVAVLRKRGVN